MTGTVAGGTATVQRRVGRDLLPGGRVVRLLAGLLFLASVAGGLLMQAAGPLSWRVLGLLGIVFALATAGYTALVAVLGERVLVRVDPWLGAILLYAPLAAIPAPAFVPGWAAVGAPPYIAVLLGAGG